MARPKPCKDCVDRKHGCHDDCKEYAKMQAWDERVRKEAEKERKLNEMTWKERFN